MLDDIAAAIEAAEKADRSEMDLELLLLVHEQAHALAARLRALGREVMQRARGQRLANMRTEATGRAQRHGAEQMKRVAAQRARIAANRERERGNERTR